MRVKPVGEFVFEKDGQRYQIAASALVQGAPQKQAVGFGGESEDWSVTFTADSDCGDFEWYVTYTLGNEGLDVNDSDLVKRPAGVEVIKGVSFKPA